MITKPLFYKFVGTSLFMLALYTYLVGKTSAAAAIFILGFVSYYGGIKLEENDKESVSIDITGLRPADPEEELKLNKKDPLWYEKLLWDRTADFSPDKNWVQVIDSEYVICVNMLQYADQQGYELVKMFHDKKIIPREIMVTSSEEAMIEETMEYIFKKRDNNEQETM